MHSGITVKVLKTLREIEEIRPMWQSWPGHRDSDIDSYLTVLHSKRETVRPHVIALYAKGQLDAILAGRIDRSRFELRVGYIPVRPYANVMNFVYGALRGNSSVANEETFIQEICRALSQHEADAAYLHYLRVDSPFYELAKELPGFFRRDHFFIEEPHFSVRMPDGLEEFYRQRSHKVRRNRKLYEKRMATGFGDGVQIRCFREPGEVEQLVVEAESIAMKTYQRGLGVGFSDTLVKRRSLQLSARQGRLRGYMLYLNCLPAAFLIGDLYQGTYFCDYMAYDPTFGEYTPGMFLTSKALELCSAERVAEIDFGRGPAQYKQMLGNNQWNEAPVYIFAESLKGLELNLIKGFTSGINATLRHTLGTTGLFHRIKKTWRARAVPETEPA
jgi:hypothetical protein